MPKLARSGSFVMGEMAHAIGRKEDSPRSDPAVGTNDSYENLIPLCPKHHTMIDKASSDFPASKLREWKADWEENVRRILQPRMSTGGALHVCLSIRPTMRCEEHNNETF